MGFFKDLRDLNKAGKEMTKEMLLGGQKVLPARLQESGFSFAHPTLEGALRHTLGR